MRYVLFQKLYKTSTNFLQFIQGSIKSKYGVRADRKAKTHADYVDLETLLR